MHTVTVRMSGTENISTSGCDECETDPPVTLTTAQHPLVHHVDLWDCGGGDGTDSS